VLDTEDGGVGEGPNADTVGFVDVLSENFVGFRGAKCSVSSKPLVFKILLHSAAVADLEF